MMSINEAAMLYGRIEMLRSTLAHIVNQPVTQQENAKPGTIEYEAWIAWAKRYSKDSIARDLQTDLQTT